MIDFGEIRAGFLRSGVDPRAASEMSLYELFSMFAAMPKEGETGMTKEQVERQLEMWRALGRSDVRV